MIQKLTLDYPIPSCTISELLFENNKWKYVYYIDTPEEINDEEKDFIVYGHISSLVVKYDNMSELSTNIHFKTWSEYLEILEAQKKADLNYRIRWYSKTNKHPINTVVLENRNYNNEEISELISYLSTPMFQNEAHTVFAAVY